MVKKNISLIIMGLAVLIPFSAYAQEIHEKVIARGEFPDAFQDYHGKQRPCEVEFVSTDGNDEDFEKIYVLEITEHYDVFTIDGEKVRCKVKNYSRFQVEVLEACDTRAEGLGSIKEETLYYVNGNAYTSDYEYLLPDGTEAGIREYSSRYYGRQQISKELYDWLTETMGDDVEHKSTKKEIESGW